MRFGATDVIDPNDTVVGSGLDPVANERSPREYVGTVTEAKCLEFDGGVRGQASDIERHAEDIIKMKRRLNDIYVRHTGQSFGRSALMLSGSTFRSSWICLSSRSLFKVRTTSSITVSTR